MDSFTECRCLICYHEGEIDAFAPKTASDKNGLECPECLNNDGDHIEKIRARELIAV